MPESGFGSSILSVFFYNEHKVGEFAIDLLVEDRVIVELKTTKCFDEVHAAQCMNYLRAGNLRMCLLISFGTPRVQIRRMVLNY